MESKQSIWSSLHSIFTSLVIPVAAVIAFWFFLKVCGDGSHFQGNNNENAPLPGDILGTVYAGGYVVPILMTLFLTTITFIFERFFAITIASGRGSVVKFVRNINSLVAANRLDEAFQACDKQKGSVANVVRSALTKYTQVEADSSLTKEQKLVAIQKDVEESTSLELPTLEQNLVMLATATSLGTLLGLFGTVLGMIRAFSAMAHAGAPDAVQLSSGISEALINTALGIGTAAVALISYNYFTTKIDRLTYSIDEAGFSIVQTYAANHK